MTHIENKIREARNNYKASARGSFSVEGALVGAHRTGYLAAHREAAVQIAEKEMEIERLKEQVSLLLDVKRYAEVVKPYASMHTRNMYEKLEEAIATYDASRTEKKERA